MKKVGAFVAPTFIMRASTRIYTKNPLERIFTISSFSASVARKPFKSKFLSHRVYHFKLPIVLDRLHCLPRVWLNVLRLS